MEYNTIELINVNSRIELSNNEKCFLRLFVLNYSDEYILDFLEMKNEDLSYIKKTLKIKFKTKDWFVLIQKAFKIGILEQRDYVDPAIKEIALNYASKIVDDFKNKSSSYVLPKNILFDFDNSIMHSLNYFKMIQAHIVKLFNVKELIYLRLRYEGVDKNDITKELQFKTKREHIQMKRLILNKLSVNNLYNAYRRAFSLQLLNRADFMNIDINKEASAFYKKIVEILFSIEVDDKEKELKVYLALLAFHMRVEYSYLLKKEYSEPIAFKIA